MIPHPLNPFGFENEYKRKLQYIENTGTQWIETNVQFDKDFDFLIKSKVAIGQNGRSLVVGNYSPSIANQTLNLEFSSSNQARGYCALGGNTADIYSNRLEIGVVYNIDLDFVSSNKSLSLLVNGEKQKEATAFNGTRVDKLNFKIFNDYRTIGMFTNVKIYSIDVYKNNMKVLSLIPVLDFQNVPCFFDKVTKTFLYNQGTGNFIYE